MKPQPPKGASRQQAYISAQGELYPFQHTPHGATHSNRYPRSLMWLRNNWRALCISLDELRSSPLASCISLCVLAVAISLPLAFYLLLQNIQRLTPIQQLNPSVSLYLDQSANRNDANHLITQIQSWPDITHVSYISPQQGLQQLSKQLQLSSLLNEMTHNPLPAVIQIQPDNRLQTPSAMTQLSNKLNTLPGVQQVQVDSSWIKRMYYLLETGQHLAACLMLLFTCGVVLITTHTLQHSLEQHRQEILVLQLMGAPSLMIRGPLLYRGIWLGLVSGLLALGIIFLLFHGMQPSVSALAATYGTSFRLHALSASFSFITLTCCTILGWAGAHIAFLSHKKRQVMQTGL